MGLTAVPHFLGNITAEHDGYDEVVTVTSRMMLGTAVAGIAKVHAPILSSATAPNLLTPGRV